MKRKYTKPRKGIPSNPFMRGNDFLAKLKAQPTLEAKQDLVKEHNPYLFAFGDHLKTQKPYEDYADWVNRLYIGATHDARTISP